MSRSPGNDLIQPLRWHLRRTNLPSRILPVKAISFRSLAGQIDVSTRGYGPANAIQTGAPLRRYRPTPSSATVPGNSQSSKQRWLWPYEERTATTIGTKPSNFIESKRLKILVFRHEELISDTGPKAKAAAEKTEQSLPEDFPTEVSQPTMSKNHANDPTLTESAAIRVSSQPINVFAVNYHWT